MKSKSIDEYFEAARGIKVAMSFEEVQALVKIKGVTPPKKPWWTTKNLLIMTTTLIATTASILLLNSTKEVSTSSHQEEPVVETQEEIAKTNIDQTFMEPVVEPEYVATAPTNENDEFIPENVEKISASSMNGSNPKAGLNATMATLPSLDSLISMNTAPTEPDTAKRRVQENVSYNSNTKTIEKTLELSDVEWLEVNNSKGDIVIDTWDKETIKLVAYITVDGNKESDVETALKHLGVSMEQRGKKVEVKNASGGEDECGCTTTIIKNGRVKFKDGQTAKVKKIAVDYEIMIPKSMNLELKASYGDIELASFDGDLKAYAMQGDITAGDVTGSVDITQKYGDLSMGDFADGEVYLFHGDAVMGTAKELELDAKYSNAEIEGVNKLEIELFQSDAEVLETVKEIEGVVKYGDLELAGNVETLELETFHAKLTGTYVGSIEIDGSYSNVKIDKIGDLELKRSFNDKFDIIEVEELVGSAKYSNFDIEFLDNNLDIETFNGSLDIDDVSKSFESLKIESKYTAIDLNFEKDAKFNLDANTSYTNFSFPEEEVKVEYKSEQNNQMELKGIYNESSSKEASVVNMNCFQGRVSFR